jgi:P4 family phage/plasmid primase-like protien
MVCQKLLGFLNNHPKTENGKHTHIIYAPSPGKSYTIPDDKLDEFYKLLSHSLFAKKDKISIVEKLQPTCRLVIDLDFKYKEKQSERQYNDVILDKIIKNFFSNIDTLYELSEEQKVCWVMEKDNICNAPQKGYESKDGIHFIFPYIIAEKKTYKKLRELILECSYREIFESEEKIPPSNTMDEIVDEAIYKGGNWFIYGSGKPKESMKYKLTSIKKVSSDILINLPIEMYLDDPLEIMKNNSVTNHTDINVVYTEELSNKLKTKALKNSSSMESIDSVEIHPAVLTATQKHDLEIARKLTMILSVERAGNYTDWLDVGYCLNGISPDLLKTWIAFSKKWSMFNDATECNKQWEWFQRNNNKQITIASLHFWAKHDDPDGYKDILRDSLEKLVEISIRGDKATGPHADVANVIFHYFKDFFVCSNIRENLWYFFNEFIGGRWEMTEQGHKLRSRLSNEIVDLYMYYQLKYQKMANLEEEGSEFQNIYNNRVSNCSKVIIKLKDSGYKDKIMKECREYFYDNKFCEKLDDQKHLLGFENGIYDLNKSIFRGGLPSDYISLSTQISLPVPKSMIPIGINDILDIVKEIEDYDELNDGLNDFLEKVFPNPDVREYTNRFLSSCLSGEVREEKFYFWTGSGGNGKSKLVDLIEMALGDYSRSMDVGYLTTKKGSSSSASPELESIKHARFVWMSEPEKCDTIYVGKLKLMSGGDKMTSRGLYKETTQFKPQFKIILMCNELPKLGGNDGGIWRRIEVVEYISKFTDDPRPSPANPHQYIADEQLTKKLEKWNVLFVVKLLDKYRKYNKEGTKPPKEVKDKTKAYRTSNDVIANWIDADLDECEGFNTFDELHDAWERWCDEEGYPPKQRPEKKEVKEALIQQQEKNEYGCVFGLKKADGCANGTKKHPKFNFKPSDD